MQNNLIVVFGLPGAGKSFVADIIASQFKYYSYNGDEALPDSMKKTLYDKGVVTDAMRREFTDTMIHSIKELSTQHKRIVIHQTFLKEFMRKQLLETFPDALFILVETNDVLREQRYIKRSYFNLGLSYLRLMSELFESPEIRHTIIVNSVDGETNIQKDLKKLL